MNRLDVMEYEYRKAISTNLNNATLYNDYGVFLTKYRKDYKQALKYFNRAIKFEPENRIYKSNFNKTIRKQEQKLSLIHNVFMVFLVCIMSWIGLNGYTNIMNLLSLFVLAQIVLTYQKNNAKKLLSYQFILN